MYLKKTLEEYSDKDIYPFHMPGHKRQLIEANPYAYDMTEVDGVDDLHDPSGPILEEEKRIARIYKSDKSFILVGGSTVGNLAAIYGSLDEGDTIIIARNSHKSIYNAATIRHLNIEYIYPNIDSKGIYLAVSYKEAVEAIAKYPKAKALIITSPTYEGYNSPIQAIAQLCHENNMLLIVDQAHGAHLGFNEIFPKSAVEDADITVMSLHKTLPCLTQTAVLHINGTMVSERRIREALDIFETSSPSYVLMSSVSRCMDIMENSGEYFKRYVDNLTDFYEIGSKLQHLGIINDTPQNKDIGKIVISTRNTNITGVQLAEMLRKEYKIETEMSSFSYLIAMTSISDTKEGFLRLKAALLDIDAKISNGFQNVPYIEISPKKVMELYQAKVNADESVVLLDDAVGKISGAMVCLYPPGAPIVLPGEKIQSEIIDLIRKAKGTGIHVTGIDRDSIVVVNFKENLYT